MFSGTLIETGGCYQTMTPTKQKAKRELTVERFQTIGNISIIIPEIN